MSSSAASIARRTTTGVFNYLDDTVIPSLYRNGRVLTRRDADGSDSGLEGVSLEALQQLVTSGRGADRPSDCLIGPNGFELLDAPLEDAIDFFDHEQVVRRYYDQCAALVSAATGARAYAFDHNIRSATGKQGRRRISGGQQVQGPAHLVHGDYTLYSAPQRLRDLTRPPGGNDTLRGVLPPDTALLDEDDVARCLADDGRFAIINVWRNIVEEPVVTHPIALCDGQSVEPRDLVVFEIHYADRVGENYFSKHADRHRWYYYPEMTRDEALLIKQWDSAGALARSDGARGDTSDASAPCTFSFHSAFDDESAPPDAPDRWSCEVRCAVLYD